MRQCRGTLNFPGLLAQNVTESPCSWTFVASVVRGKVGIEVVPSQKRSQNDHVLGYRLIS